MFRVFNCMCNFIKNLIIYNKLQLIFFEQNSINAILLIYFN